MNSVTVNREQLIQIQHKKLTPPSPRHWVSNHYRREVEKEYEFFVMDGRARFDTERASVLEALGRKLPQSWKLRRDWGGMGAVLVRAPVIIDLRGDGTSTGDFEYLSDIE
ncbi:hypothetical protein GH714_044090 [Hevea brasiliensis]|uniref:Uncharacterized protein n=1 Tax=Hevea brasiliensis TaxID=3981 RepID=A0A6A6K1T2_HEVBR|nr:hypothetical protein GH714_044090 [Hevea brasiliensis]